MFWEAGWAHVNSHGGEVSRKDAVRWLTTNFERMFDLVEDGSSESSTSVHEFVAHEVRLAAGSDSRLAMDARCAQADKFRTNAQRDPFEFGSRAVAVGQVDGTVQLLE